MTAPSITIPAGHNADRLLAVFATANSAAITLPGAVSSRWNFHAIGYGISAAMGDASVPSGATGDYVALQGSSAVNIGAQVALQPAPGSATPTPDSSTDRVANSSADRVADSNTDCLADSDGDSNANGDSNSCTDADTGAHGHSHSRAWRNNRAAQRRHRQHLGSQQPRDHSGPGGRRGQ